MDDVLGDTVNQEWGRISARLLARFRRLDLVEDALGDAVEAAARSWPVDGVPDSPAAWLTTAAHRRVLDRLRHEAVARGVEPELVIRAEHAQAGATAMADPGGLVEDDLLRLVLMCAHPALSTEAASALSLRLVMGVSTHDIARLFLVPESTMAARITRAKRKISGAGIPFTVPDASVLPDRLDIVAQTAYLAFTAGYSPGSGPDLLRPELSGEAIRLVRLVRALRPEEPVLLGLLALMLLQHSRRDARVRAERLVLLADQDRSAWHHGEVAEALGLLRDPVLTRPLTRQAASYTLQARIAAEHALAPTASETRWDRIVSLYDVLLEVAPSPGARLARAVAVAEDRGAAAGLAALEGVEVPSTHRLAAVRAELLSRSGDVHAARAAYDQALAACANDVERAHLTEKRAALGRAQPRTSPG
ncbi:RNA polymerase subunit sigma-24 [Nocardioides seonyuensis]|uniref:RNA polymerase subunit sigma-24 n=1 Tax=Nocardioides seonyuensis TaxID=2518371 RepID=A0A4P7IL91_9ACTN|nr:DUF6596 domain-containing protein [Nocardioides seonyuensis]QBX56841.1 RNA polymerase subunit sigma-24 [Nocardioides seonyuensis]